MTREILFSIFVAWAAILLVCESCNATFGDENGAGDSDGDADTDGSGDTDGDSDDDTEVCDEESIDIVPAPARLMILMDMSGSMDPEFNDATEKWDDPSNPGRWSIARSALIFIFDSFGDEDIEFGLDFFPNSVTERQNCNVGDDVYADVAPKQAKTLRSSLPGNNAPEGSTPLYCAMDNFLDTGYAPYFSSIEAESFLLVISDGSDRCDTNCPNGNSGSGVSAANLGNKAAELLDANVRTFVIGFGGGVDTNQLNRIAQNGGTDFDTFIPADDQDALEDAISNVTSSIISCVYDVGTPDKTADEDHVNFYIDDDPVAYDENCDANNGWSWTNAERTLVRFCEKSCESFQDGEDHDISIKWGCPADVPPL